MYKRIEKCRLCGNTDLVRVLDLGVQVLTGVFPKSRTEPVTAGPLCLVKCSGADACNLVQLEHRYDPAEMYGTNYGYRSGLNPSMVAHLSGIVKRLLAKQRLLPESVVIDIGSNDSTTLQAYPKGGCVPIGVDPTGAKFRQYYPPHIALVPDFFPSEQLNHFLKGRRAAIITSFSMLYDLDDPLGFAQNVAEKLEDEGLWVFEQSYMPSMLERNSYDTVCHEHQEYYGLSQIKWMADRANLKLVDVEFNDINGGSFQVTAAKGNSAHPVSPVIDQVLERERQQGLHTLRPYMEFGRRVEESRKRLRRFLDNARQEGKTVYGLGASTKGNVILQYCGVTDTDLAQIGEVNDEKFGAYTPGSLIPIVPEQQVLAGGADYLLVLPWHFRKFFTEGSRFPRGKLLFPLPFLEVV